MNRLIAAFAVVSLSVLSMAQTPTTTSDPLQANATAAGEESNASLAVPRSALATTDCAFNFTSGGLDTGLSYCVTVNGNIPQLATPELHEHLASKRSEGYGICDQSTGVAYNDYGDTDSFNWLPATVVSSSATSVKIARTTIDGLWTLTQTIAEVTGNSPSVKITMTLKNNSGIARLAWLLRYADADIDGLLANDFNMTIDAAAASNSITGPWGSTRAYGLLLQNIGNNSFAHQALVQNTRLGPAPCNPFAVFPQAPLVFQDGSLALMYQPFIGAGASVTATMMYKGF